MTDLVPAVADFLAHSCATMLVISGEYAKAGRQAWSAGDQDAMARASQTILTRYHQLHALLADYVPDSIEAMVVPLEYVRGQMGRMTADRWYERVATCWVVGGFMNDFYRVLATGLPGALANRVTEIFSSTDDEDALQDVLGRVVELDSEYVSRVSLWARRLVGDTMLIARHVLPRINQPTTSGDSFEPLFTDVLHSHTRRLDGLGLTA